MCVVLVTETHRAPRHRAKRLASPPRRLRSKGTPVTVPVDSGFAASRTGEWTSPSGDLDTQPIAISRATEVARPHLATGRDRGVLIVTAGADLGRVISLPEDKILAVGRADNCCVRFDHPGLSRVHANVFRDGLDYVFKDVGSTNGSWVNRSLVTGTVALRDGDHLLLGGTTSLRFHLVDAQEEATLRSMYEAAVFDGLTGVLNRKALDERLGAEVAFASRHGTPLSVAMIDLDHFKEINDSHGHQAGDSVLRAVAQIVNQAVRVEDVVGRYGGEEFCIIVRGAEAQAARAVADRLRAAIEQTPIGHDGSHIRVTASAGVTDLNECWPQRDLATLIGIADGRLYKAKHAGRNRVVGP